MAKDDAASSNPPKSTNLHPAYSVTNIQSKIRTLDGKNVTYTAWVRLFKLHAVAYKVSDHIDGTPAPDPTTAEYPLWLELDALVLQWIYSTVSDDLLGRCFDAADGTARAAWVQLAKVFLSNKQARAAALETQFVNLTLAACTNLDDYLQRLKELANQLGDVDQPVSESRMVLQLVRGLPAEYDTTAALINQQHADWDTARTMLQDDVIRQEARRSTTSSVMHTASVPQQPNTSAPAPNSSAYSQYSAANQHNQQPQQYSQQRGRGRGRGRSSRVGGSRGRGRPGYSGWTNTPGYPNWAWWNTPPCPYPTTNSWQPNNYNPQQFSAQHSGPNPPTVQAQFTSFPPTAPPNYNPAQQSFSPSPQTHGYNALCPSDLSAAFSAMQLNQQDPTKFMDTGAETHVTQDQGTISIPSSSTVRTKILVGDGNSIPIKGSGTCFCILPNRTYIFPNLLYSPQIIKNLISVRRFTRDNNVSVEFDPFGFSLKDLISGRLLSRHNSTGDLYPLTPPELPPQACFLTTTSLPWHDRLGHPGAQVFDVLFHHFNLSCNKDDSSNFCNSCQLSNSKRLPFFASNSFTFSPFDIIHCDLWTSPITSKTGYKYYMVLIDNFSHFIWVYPLKYKSETFPTVVKFHRLIATQFNRLIKTFQCDLGGEFDNHAFKNFAHQNGLLFRFSCPQTSPQNGRAKRMIRRLNDIIRSLLIHANLPPIFWVEALHTAAYLHNILPTTRLNFFTPTFALYLRHPSYDHLRVFGCACYPNTSATQPHKLHPRAIRCIFLGYPPDFRGYRCLDPTTGKVHIS